MEVPGSAASGTATIATPIAGVPAGGILVALAEKFGLPVHFIGVGEGIDDLSDFTARDFARALVGLDG